MSIAPKPEDFPRFVADMREAMSQDYDWTDSTTLADGTTIGYRQIGSGSGLILLPGGFQASQHGMRLTTAISDVFTVSVLDRRGVA